MKTLYFYTKNLLEKGKQTGLKHDSLSAFLFYHSDKELELLQSKIYFVRKNQFHIYDIERNEFHIIKTSRKKKKYNIDLGAMYFPFDENLYFLTNVSPFILAFVPADFDKKE